MKRVVLASGNAGKLVEMGDSWPLAGRSAAA
jgi:hypothetical protein